MVVKTYRWHPVTCDCVIIETHDTDTNDFNASSFEHKCAFHTLLSDVQAYGAIIKNADSEQKRIGQSRHFMLTNISKMTQTVQNPDGTTTIDWKNGVTVMFGFGGTGDSRVVTISISGVSLTNNEKNQIQQFCDNRFGVGKVLVV